MAVLPLEEITVSASISAPDMTQLTTVALDGTGAFDKLMIVTQLHLQKEYDEGRITQDEYSTVYLGAMQSVLAQAVQFLLNHQSQEKILAEVGLLRQKTVTELAQTDDTIPAGLGFNGTTAVEGLVKLQKDVADQEILVKAQEVLNMQAQVALTGQKVITELAQTDDELTGATAFGLNNTYTVVEGLIKAQTNKITAEEEHAQQKTVTEMAAVSDTLPNDYGQSLNTTLEGVLAATKLKTEAEVDLLDQKTVSELAQTHASVPAGEGLQQGGYSVAGVLGAQVTLFAKQTDGFDRDAEQKLAKIFADMKATQIAADSDSTMTSTNMTNPDIGDVMQHAMDGHSVP